MELKSTIVDMELKSAIVDVELKSDIIDMKTIKNKLLDISANDFMCIRSHVMCLRSALEVYLNSQQADESNCIKQRVEQQGYACSLNWHNVTNCEHVNFKYKIKVSSATFTTNIGPGDDHIFELVPEQEQYAWVKKLQFEPTSADLEYWRLNPA